MINLAKRLAGAVLPRSVFLAGRKLAAGAGLVEAPPFQYPFWKTMHLFNGERPNYLWGTLCAASLARALGIPRISVIEFGVAGGNGLVALERAAEEAERLSQVGIDVYGFDTGRGLPKPKDYRDLPQLWSEGNYRMDVERLQKRLSRARLLLGPVEETVPEFMKSDFAPVGFVSFDLDTYHSTMDAFTLLGGNARQLLPRVVCYFDDIFGFSHSDFSGERLAISDFNARSAQRKISQIHGLRYVLALDHGWTHMMYMFHDFEHPHYNDYDGSNPLTELPLASGAGAPGGP